MSPTRWITSQGPCHQVSSFKLSEGSNRINLSWVQRPFLRLPSSKPAPVTSVHCRDSHMLTPPPSQVSPAVRGRTTGETTTKSVTAPSSHTPDTGVPMAASHKAAQVDSTWLKIRELPRLRVAEGDELFPVTELPRGESPKHALEGSVERLTIPSV